MSLVKWVVPSRLFEHPLSASAVPVIPLADLEAWLKGCIENGYVNTSQCVDDVQAMKEGV